MTTEIISKIFMKPPVPIITCGLFKQHEIADAQAIPGMQPLDGENLAAQGECAEQFSCKCLAAPLPSHSLIQNQRCAVNPVTAVGENAADCFLNRRHPCVMETDHAADIEFLIRKHELHERQIEQVRRVDENELQM